MAQMLIKLWNIYYIMRLPLLSYSFSFLTDAAKSSIFTGEFWWQSAHLGFQPSQLWNISWKLKSVRFMCCTKRMKMSPLSSTVDFMLDLAWYFGIKMEGSVPGQILEDTSDILNSLTHCFTCIYLQYLHTTFSLHYRTQQLPDITATIQNSDLLRYQLIVDTKLQEPSIPFWHRSDDLKRQTLTLAVRLEENTPTKYPNLY